MPECLAELHEQDFFDPNCLAQLADDTAIFAGKIKMLKEKLSKIFDYSDKNFQVINIDKTKYIHLYDAPYV